MGLVPADSARSVYSTSASFRSNVIRPAILGDKARKVNSLFGPVGCEEPLLRENASGNGTRGSGAAGRSKVIQRAAEAEGRGAEKIRGRSQRPKVGRRDRGPDDQKIAHEDSKRQHWPRRWGRE